MKAWADGDWVKIQFAPSDSPVAYGVEAAETRRDQITEAIEQARKNREESRQRNHMSSARSDFPGHILVNIGNTDHGMDIASAEQFLTALTTAIRDARVKYSACPFCGFTDCLEEEPADWDANRIRCKNCWASGPPARLKGSAAASAVDLWNHRV